MFLFHWKGVLNDWGQGSVVAVAEDLAAARNVAKEELKRHYLTLSFTSTEEELYAEDDYIAEKYNKDCSFIDNNQPKISSLPCAISFVGSQ